MRRSKVLKILLTIFFVYLCLFSIANAQQDVAKNLIEKNKNRIIFYDAVIKGKENPLKGKGFIIKENVMIAPYHLVSNADKITAKNYIGEDVKINNILGIDKKLDIVFLEVESEAEPFQLADSLNVKVGDKIFIPGVSESKELILKQGEIKKILDFGKSNKIFKTDIISHLNFCGSPMINNKGQVLGINFVLEEQSSFIIPVNYFKDLKKLAKPVKFKKKKNEEYFKTSNGINFAAEVFFILGKSYAAEKYLKKLTESKPQDLENYFKLAYVYMDQRNYEACFDTYNKILEIKPDNSEAYYGKGLVNIKMRNYQKSIAPLKKSLELGNNNKKTYYYLGVAYQETKDLKTAVENYQKFINSNPEERLDAYKRIATCQKELKNFDEAVRYFREVVKTEPENKVILHNLGDCLEKKGEFDNAANIYLKIAENDPGRERYYYNRIMKMYEKAGNPEKAISVVEKMIELEPDNGDNYYYLGYISQKLGKYKNAVEALEKAREKNPEFGEKYAYLINLGKGYNNLKRYGEAVGVYKKLTTLFPDRAESWFNLGITYVLEKEWMEGAKILRKAVKMDPNNARALYSLTVCFLNLKDMQMARETYNKLSKINPGLARKLTKYMNQDQE